jgi:hypothetical protein
MQEAGFVKVHVVIRDVAPNPDDKELQELGKLQMDAFLQGLQGSIFHIFTEILDWSQERLVVHLAEVRNDLTKGKIQASCHCVRDFGQRPECNAGLPSQLSSGQENHLYLTNSRGIMAYPSILASRHRSSISSYNE